MRSHVQVQHHASPVDGDAATKAEESREGAALPATKVSQDGAPRSQSQTKDVHDTSMGRLEHRLETEMQEADAGMQAEHTLPHVTDYNAWVHGDNTKHNPSAQKPWGTGVAQPRT